VSNVEDFILSTALGLCVQVSSLVSGEVLVECNITNSALYKVLNTVGM
jgi:hypothetical protein